MLRHARFGIRTDRHAPGPTRSRYRRIEREFSTHWSMESGRRRRAWQRAGSPRPRNPRRRPPCHGIWRSLDHFALKPTARPWVRGYVRPPTPSALLSRKSVCHTVSSRSIAMPAQPTDKPNIIWIFGDQHRAQALFLHGRPQRQYAQHRPFRPMMRLSTHRRRDGVPALLSGSRGDPHRAVSACLRPRAITAPAAGPADHRRAAQGRGISHRLFRQMASRRCQGGRGRARRCISSRDRRGGFDERDRLRMDDQVNGIATSTATPKARKSPAIAFPATKPTS